MYWKDYQDECKRPTKLFGRWLTTTFHNVKNRFSLRHGNHPMAPVNIRPRRLVDTMSIQLVEFDQKDTVPPYAVISHRWIHDEEVSFQEFMNPQEEIKSKPGYLKILAACQKARKDQLGYLWIDTCCIDKGDHADVKLNIRSMYAYYQNAQICYAYLVDVDRSDIWLKRFMDSEWFRRGWTLQELLAPRDVRFFDKEWRYIGTKVNLAMDISRITTIPEAVLTGQLSIRDIDPFQRMSWTIGRRTMRPPDGGYCLSGLLGVSMDPDYNETLRRSLERLWAAFINAYPQYKDALGLGVSLLDVLDNVRAESRKTESGRVSPNTLAIGWTAVGNISTKSPGQVAEHRGESPYSDRYQGTRHDCER
ncbi:hypothetical protein D9758_007926 [Tetrapyrgos nigripes]|uniref:Heterokaryon incompatibility domain-containing protein n=1 Tax=Tetrapyrgos nigripes TaxID=182062 RepID=A0A8H5FXN6_9AGAR|nr:hypothetical protein D9758_007926 [Tetrapyrgos nigripes]